MTAGRHFCSFKDGDDSIFISIQTFYQRLSENSESFFQEFDIIKPAIVFLSVFGLPAAGWPQMFYDLQGDYFLLRVLCSPV